MTEDKACKHGFTHCEECEEPAFVLIDRPFRPSLAAPYRQFVHIVPSACEVIAKFNPEKRHA